MSTYCKVLLNNTIELRQYEKENKITDFFLRELKEFIKTELVVICEICDRNFASTLYIYESTLIISSIIDTWMYKLGISIAKNSGNCSPHILKSPR